MDEGSFGDQLAARVARREIGRRLPVAEIVTLGSGDAPPLDCVVVTSTAVGLEHLLDVDCRPVAWHGVTVDGEHDGAALRKALASHAHVFVADEGSKRRLEDLGVDAEVTVVPHPAVLAPRLFPPALVEKRLAYLRLMGWYPPEGQPLFLHTDRDVVDAVEAVQRLAGDLPLVVAGDDIADRLPGFRLPAVGVEDLVAAVAGAAGVVTTSTALAAAALAYGRPNIVVGADTVVPDELPPAPAPEMVRRSQDELDGSYDCVAAIATEAAARRPDRSSAEDVHELLDTVDALRRASAAQARRLVAQRLAFADESAELSERLRQAEESLTAHGAVVAAQKGVIADQKRALIEHQQAMLSLAAAVEAQGAEVERARTVFEGVQAHVASVEARLAEEAAARSRADAEVTAIRASRSYRASSTLARLLGLARRRRR